ncbi:Equilibrative nucleotide transporter 1, partial [Bienertia sinuspersici]
NQKKNPQQFLPFISQPKMKNIISYTSYIVPYNTFITAVDYFHYLYPDRSVDRIFTSVYQSLSLLWLLLIVFCFRRIQAYVRVNVGSPPSVGLVGFSGLSNALVQGGLVGSATVLPKRYTQAVVFGASASESSTKQYFHKTYMD